MENNIKQNVPNIVDIITKPKSYKIFIVHGVIDLKNNNYIETGNGTIGKIIYKEDNTILVNIVSGNFYTGDILNNCCVIIKCYELSAGKLLFRNQHKFLRIFK